MFLQIVSVLLLVCSAICQQMTLTFDGKTIVDGGKLNVTSGRSITIDIKVVVSPGTVRDIIKVEKTWMSGEQQKRAIISEDTVVRGEFVNSGRYKYEKGEISPSLDQFTDSLRIDDLSPSDSGTISVQFAPSKNYKVETTFDLVVIGEPTSVWLWADLDGQLRRYENADRLTVNTTRDTGAGSSDSWTTAIIQCRVVGNPEPNLQVKVGMDDLSDRFTLIDTTMGLRNMSLSPPSTIYKFQDSNFVVYPKYHGKELICAGSYRTVEAGELKRDTLVTLDVQFAPYVEKDKIVTIEIDTSGKSFTIVLPVFSNPGVTSVQWMDKQGRNITTSEEYQVMETENTDGSIEYTLKLVVNKPPRRDTTDTDYTVIVSNSLFTREIPLTINLRDAAPRQSPHSIVIALAALTMMLPHLFKFSVSFRHE